MSLESMMTHRLTLQRPDVQKDASAGTTRETWDDVEGQDLRPASVQPVSSRDRFLYAQRQLQISHRVYTPAAWGARRGDRLYDPDTGKYYLITGEFDQAGRGEVYRTDVLEWMS